MCRSDLGAIIKVNDPAFKRWVRDHPVDPRTTEMHNGKHRYGIVYTGKF